MEGLPLLPGFSFKDPTQSKFHVTHSFDYRNGHQMPRQILFGVGQQPLDVNSIQFCKATDTVRYDPSITYGRTKHTKLKSFQPHFLIYDKKCLTFFAFFRQTVNDSPDEHFRIRLVNIIYFLEDDTITVMEPVVKDSGFPQGRLVKRNRIQKSTIGDFWHWKDFNIGIDIAIYGIVYHISNCDEFTKEYMLSQGVELNEPEEVPYDPYIKNRQLSQLPSLYKTPNTADDKLRRFLEFDRKILRFFAVWDDRKTEHGELRPFVLRYYLSDDSIDVGEVKKENSGRDPNSLLIGRMKLPKKWRDAPADYPAAYLEKTDYDVVEYFQPRDFLVGNTYNIMARNFFLYDCDGFTRLYYAKCLNIEQPAAMDVPLYEEKKPVPKPPPPPHIAFGTPDDTLASCLSFIPKPPKKDVLKYLLNSGKKLRYSVSLISVHPEDEGREFVMEYNLGDSKLNICELQVRNSGFAGGQFLSPILLPKPGSDKDNPDYYTPKDFAIGAEVNVFGHRFKIEKPDLKVYRYMEANPEKFTPDMITDFRNFFMREGLLDGDIALKAQDEIQREGCTDVDFKDDNGQ